MDNGVATLHQVIAAYIQAGGAVVAIFVAMRLASREHRAEVARREREEERATYLLEAELNWLSSEVVNFLNQFSGTVAGNRYGYTISSDDVADLLERLSWCRQRAEHRGQLAMLGELRQALMSTVRLLRMKEKYADMMFGLGEIALMDKNLDAVLRVQHHVAKIKSIDQYRP